MLVSSSARAVSWRVCGHVSLRGTAPCKVQLEPTPWRVPTFLLQTRPVSRGKSRTPCWWLACTPVPASVTVTPIPALKPGKELVPFLCTPNKQVSFLSFHHFSLFAASPVTSHFLPRKACYFSSGQTSAGRSPWAKLIQELEVAVLEDLLGPARPQLLIASAFPLSTGIPWPRSGGSYTHSLPACLNLLMLRCGPGCSWARSSTLFRVAAGPSRFDVLLPYLATRKGVKE